MRGGDAAAQLLRALARQAGGSAVLSHDGVTPWSSATFVGGQHRVTVTGDLRWLAGLEETDLPMRGCFTASVEVARSLDGAILTVLVLDA